MKSNPDLLDRCLRQLPRHRASSNFTARVMRKIEDLPQTGSARRSLRPVWATLAATLVAAAAVTVLTMTREPLEIRSDEAPKSTEIEDLRRQHDLLARELSELRSRAEGAAPVLYLGSVDEVDYVLDLTPFVPSRDLRRDAASGADLQPIRANREFQ